MKKLLYILLLFPLFFVSSCEEDCETIPQGFDCERNVIAQIGDVMEGGYLFYVDETGKHGLVAALEDLSDGATDSILHGLSGYEWGCSGVNVSGAYGIVIGTGYLNTIGIVTNNCQTFLGGMTAAQAVLSYTSNGYNDWFLPSKNELAEMYNTIGNGGVEPNIGDFQSNLYWSSSEYGSNFSFSVVFGSGSGAYSSKGSICSVRAVRAF